jgi:hypothetical protein
MANSKTKNAKLLQLLGTSLVASMLLVGCAKDLPEKKPDNFDRDVHAISKFSGSVIVEATGAGTLALEGENEVERGILAINDGQMYDVKVISGDATVTKLFEGLKLRASRPGERFKFNFKLTENNLIAYMETEGHLLSEMQEALTTTYKGKKQIPVFNYGISYGSVEKRKNVLEEETRYVQFKGEEVANATAIKFTGTQDARYLSALRGHPDKEKVYSKSKITKKIWTGQEIKSFFQVKDEDKANFDEKIFRTKIVDSTMYFQLPLSKVDLADETKALDLLKNGNDPRISTCDDSISTRAEVAADCVLYPVFEVGISNVNPKYNLDSKTQVELDSIALESVVASKAKFIKTDMNSYLTEFNYNKDKDQFSLSSLKGSIYSGKEAKNILNRLKIKLPSRLKLRKTHSNEFLTKDIIGINIVDKKVYVQLPVKKSDLPILEVSAAKPDVYPYYAHCPQQALSLLSTTADDCVMKPVFSRDISYKLHKITFNPDSDLPTIEERSGTRKESSFVTVDLDDELVVVEGYAGAGARWEEFFKIEDLNKEHTSKQDVANIIETLNIKEYKAPKAVKTKIVNDYVWFLEPVQKSSLSKLELAIAEREIEQNLRYELCSEEMAKAANLNADECILKPTFKRSALYRKGKFLARQDRDADTYEVHPAGKDDAEFVYLYKEGYASKFQFEDYTAIVKNEVLIDLKNDIDTKKDFLYVPMSSGTPRDVAAAAPFFQGEEKIVRFRLIEAGIEVYEPEKDDRFSENDLNAKPVLLIPGRYVDFKCSEDDRGNCQSALAYDTDKDWNQKRFFIPNFESLQVLEKNTLEVWGLGGNPCVYPVNTAMAKTNPYVLEPKSVLNINLRRTYKVSGSMSCINQFYTSEAFLSALSFKSDFYYSIVALDEIATPGYNKLVYPYSDTMQFGFFKGDITKMSLAHDRQRGDQEYRLNRWNPKLEKLVYYKSETFNLRENNGRKNCRDYKNATTIANYNDIDFYNEIKCALNKSTKDAVTGMNKSLKMANVNFEIEMREPSKDVNPGDLRYNTLVLIDDPLDNGLLGYAPTVTNPRTGEIVQGHVNMYSGVLVGMSRRVYKGMQRLTINQLKAEGNLSFQASSEDKGVASELVAVRSKDDVKQATNKFRKSVKIATPQFNRESNDSLKEEMKNIKSKLEAKDQESVAKAKDSENAIEKRLDFWAKNNAYPAEGYLVSNTLGKRVFKKIKNDKELYQSNGLLKEWEDLTKRQQMKVVVAMIAHTYTTTLVHEFGHNLGLRHNFKGSYDRKNFYTEAERKELGIEQNPHYSSIMDYGFSELNELPIFGKYDVAALRYGYAREVETNGGQFVKIPEGKSLRDSGIDMWSYDFCTDGNVGTSPKCHRFDEGTNLTEIAKHFRDKFENSYFTSNFRDGRKTFNTYSVWHYTNYSRYVLSMARDIFGEYERSVNIFEAYFKNEELAEWDIEKKGCTGLAKEKLPEWFCTDINDAITATTTIGDMLLDIVKTPDAQCLLTDPNGSPVLLPLRDIHNYMWQHFRSNNAASSCYDPGIVAWLKNLNYKVLGERGKFLTSMDETNSKYGRYSNDISVRGIWPAKILAMRYLTVRRSQDAGTDSRYSSFIEHVSIGPKILTLLDEIANEKPITDFEKFVDINGKEIPAQYQLPYNFVNDKTTYIREQGHPYVIRSLRLPWWNGTQLNKELLKQASIYNWTKEEKVEEYAKAFSKYISVGKYERTAANNLEGFETILIGDLIYAANDENELAKQLIADYKAATVLNKYDPQLITKVVNQRTKPTLPADFSPAQKALTRLPENIIDIMVGWKHQSIPMSPELKADIIAQVPNMADDIILGYTLEYKEMKDTVATVEKLRNTPPADATEAEKELYKHEIEALVNFVENGGVDTTALEKRIKYLPGYYR